MKRLLFLSLMALAACNGENKTEDKSKMPVSLVNNPHTADGVDTVTAAMKPTMDFKDTTHDFGNLHEGEKVSFDFEFTNNGKTPLVISSASGSCGCTVPEFPRDPVAPGASAKMKVTFNSTGKSGHQEKSVTIRTNTLRNVHMLYIKSEVQGGKESKEKLMTE
jgi:hypothetical protein